MDTAARLYRLNRDSHPVGDPPTSRPIQPLR